MSTTIEGAGALLAYDERGTGAPVLLVHDMASDRRALEPIAAALEPAARVIAYDRRGYGESGAPAPYAATTVHEQAEDAAALLDGLGVRDAVIAGDGFGALIALDLLLRHGDLVRGAVLADPPLYAFVADNEPLSAQRAMLEAAVREGGPAHAVGAWLGADADPAVVARARSAHGAFFADFGGLASLPVTRAALRAIAAPVVVLTRPSAPPPILVAADALAALLPGARRSPDGDLVAAVASLL
jgi:pimeloyl-ACP methyl ester carboxylesterase